MEYLTLQDIPHRHYSTLDSRAMASDKHHHHHGSALPGIAANNHARNSPPFQPGEQRSAATLPSFSQFLSATQREPSPPRTPSRRDASMESSPTNKAPHFDDVSWDSAAVGKRRRVDVTHGSEHGIYDTRRPSVIDPTLSSTFSSPRGSIAPIVPPPMPNHHHRPSLPYPPPPSSAVHARHQSSPAPHGHVTYHHQPPPSMMTPTVYAPGQSHGTPSPYSHRPSYYHDTRQTSHSMSYDAPPHDFYQQSAYAPHPAYPLQDPYSHQSSPYSNLQFQPHHGVDQSFNRKRRGNLPKEATGLLKGWFNDHRESPYPSEEEKMALCTATGLTLNQVSNWFINARRRAPGKEARDRENNNDDA